MKIALLSLLTAGLIVPTGVKSVPEVINGRIPARVIGVVAGDTIVVKARIWLRHDVETRIRLDGVDAPELKGKCDVERRLAREAKALVAKLADDGRVVHRNIQYGKYAGRVVARVETPSGVDFLRALFEAGLVRAYDGRRRHSCCVPPAPQ